jgi:hypothetical protein
VTGASLRGDYLRTIAAAGLTDIEVVSDKSFLEMALAISPRSSYGMLRRRGLT